MLVRAQDKCETYSVVTFLATGTVLATNRSPARKCCMICMIFFLVLEAYCAHLSTKFQRQRWRFQVRSEQIRRQNVGLSRIKFMICELPKLEMVYGQNLSQVLRCCLEPSILTKMQAIRQDLRLQAQIFLSEWAKSVTEL